MAIKLIIFDLDDTLLDTTLLLIPIARTPAFHQRIREKLPLMDGALNNLEVLSKKYQLALLTYGDVVSQKQKVESLGIGHFFQKKYFADPTKCESKSQYFAKALREFKLTAGEAMSIGNRRSTDVREAKLLGLKTCLFHYGEHSSENVLQPADQPDYVVTEHGALISTCHL